MERRFVRILLLEDDPILGDAIETGLRLDGHRVDWLAEGDLGADALRDETFDGVILDLGLPGRSGMEILVAWRREGDDTPVLVLTAMDAIETCVAALDAGADDYLVKPAELIEIEARLRALARRRAGRSRDLLEQGALRLDRSGRLGWLDNQPLDLSTYEFSILEALTEGSGRVITRESLVSRLYGWSDGPESNSIEVLIHRLRRKLGRDRIETVRGAGYRLAA